MEKVILLSIPRPISDTQKLSKERPTARLKYRPHKDKM